MYVSQNIYDGHIVMLVCIAGPRAKKRVPHANQDKLVDVHGSPCSLIITNVLTFHRRQCGNSSTAKVFL